MELKDICYNDAIKAIYPDIKKTDYKIIAYDDIQEIQDWTYSGTIPTDQDLIDAYILVKEEQDLANLRNERDALLNETDKYLLEDFPITTEQKTELVIYRQSLRDSPIIGTLPDKPIWL